MRDIRRELRDLKAKHGIIEYVKCDKDETKAFIQLTKNNQSLPDDIIIRTLAGGDTEFVRCVENDLTKDEIIQIVMLGQMEYLKSINSMVTFFTIITILALAGGIISIFMFLK